MNDVTMPKLLEFMQRKSLTKGRVRTTLRLFMIDPDIFDMLASRYVSGVISTIECRVGETVKHPKDKFDKVIAKQEAVKKLQKTKYPIKRLVSTGEVTTITIAIERNETLYIIKDKYGIRVKVPHF